MIQGYGDSLNMTCLFSILVTDYSDDICRADGILEASNSAGILMNSVLASMVHSYFGFKAPFFLNSFLYVLLGFIAVTCIPKSVNRIQ